jgi:hypothetical protein
MDITKELKELNSTDNFGNKILQELEVQQDEFNKKLYLIQMLSAAKEIESMVNEGFFKLNNIDWLYMNIYESKFEKKFHKITMRVGGENFIKDSHEQEFYNLKIKKIFKNIEEINLKLVNEELLINHEFYLDLIPGVEQKILDLFLSDELKKVLEYNQMQLELSNNNDSNNKKLKL